MEVILPCSSDSDEPSQAESIVRKLTLKYRLCLNSAINTIKDQPLVPAVHQIESKYCILVVLLQQFNILKPT